MTVSRDKQMSKKQSKKSKQWLKKFVLEKLKEIELACCLAGEPLSSRDVEEILVTLQNEEYTNKPSFFQISQSDHSKVNTLAKSKQ